MTPTPTPSDTEPDTLDPERAAQRERNQATRALLRKWMADESGYDERVWPIVKRLIEENSLSDRKRFSD